jgi:hypothetical protein
MSFDELDAPRTPSQSVRNRHRRKTYGGSHSRQLECSPDEDRSLQPSALDMSFEEGAECSTGEMSSCAPMSVPSSSWSPASIHGVEKRRKSKRRSLTEMSEADRMTPKELERQGLGIPWQRAHNICTIDLNAGEVDNRAREFCLIPTPELMKGEACQDDRPRVSPPITPSRSPGTMQRRFVDRVWRASLGQSPCSEGSYTGLASTSIEVSPLPSPACYEIPSPIPPVPEETDLADLVFSPDRRFQVEVSPAIGSSTTAFRSNLLFTPAGRPLPRLPFGSFHFNSSIEPDVTKACSGDLKLSANAMISSGRFGQENAESRSRLGSRVQQQILKARRQVSSNENQAAFPKAAFRR